MGCVDRRRGRARTSRWLGGIRFPSLACPWRLSSLPAFSPSIPVNPLNHTPAHPQPIPLQIVIGSGPAGQKCAIDAVKRGYRVAMVDKNSQMGGVCVVRVHVYALIKYTCSTHKLTNPTDHERAHPTITAHGHDPLQDLPRGRPPPHRCVPSGR